MQRYFQRFVILKAPPGIYCNIDSFKRRTIYGNGIVKPMLRSLLISYVLSGILLAALALALYKLRLKEGQVNLMVYAVYLLTCLSGGFLAGKRIRQRRFFWGLLSGLLYFLVLFAVSWAMNMGSAIDMERSVTVMGICALGGTIGGMLS